MTLDHGAPSDSDPPSPADQPGDGSADEAPERLDEVDFAGLFAFWGFFTVLVVGWHGSALAWERCKSRRREAARRSRRGALTPGEKKIGGRQWTKRSVVEAMREFRSKQTTDDVGTMEAQ